jgi:hypothetical protein
MHILESRPVGRFTVNLVPDDTGRDWGDVLGDEPILIFTRDRWGRTSVQHDGTRDVRESMLDVLRLADESYSWTDVLDAMDADWTWTDGGTLRVDSSSLKSVRYFKTADAAVRSIFRADYGKDLRDFRLHQFSTRDGWTYAVWSQAELDRYAGRKDACAPIATVQAYLDGDVYGWTITDADGDVLDSCWGYIGDAKDVLAEGEASARYLESEASARDAEVLESSRPDLYRVPA